MRTTYIVSYDITEDKRRDRVFKICKNWAYSPILDHCGMANLAMLRASEAQ